MLLFTIVSMLLTLMGLITLAANAWRHFRFIFFDCFEAFHREVWAGCKTITIDDTKYRQWDKAYKYSIKEYFLFTKAIHKNDSKSYADSFDKMQSHKLKVFFIILCKMHFADSIVIDGFEYDLHAFRLGK